jgi:hypothetical protein
MTAARQEPTPEPPPTHAAAPPKRDAESPPTSAVTVAPARDDHAVEEPGYGHGV